MYQLVLFFIAMVFAFLGGVQVVAGAEMPMPVSYSVIVYLLFGVLLFVFDVFLLLTSWRKSENYVARVHDSMLLPREAFRALFIWFFLLFLLAVKFFASVENANEKKDFRRSKRI